jgi:hypothetical protein
MARSGCRLLGLTSPFLRTDSDWQYLHSGLSGLGLNIGNLLLFYLVAKCKFFYRMIKTKKSAAIKVDKVHRFISRNTQD